MAPLVWLAVSSAALPAQARAIQDAIDAAEPGALIVLPKGKIRGALRIDRSITVRGRGPRRTRFISDGRKAALMITAPAGATVRLEKVGFTSDPRAKDHRGAGVMIRGPGQVILRDVQLKKTIRGRCLSSAVTFQPPLDIRMERVQIEDHHCFVAGVFVIEPGIRVTLVDSLLEKNRGELAGAILVSGGHLRLESTTLRGNRFVRADDGHDLVLSGSEGQVELVASDFSSASHRSVAFDDDSEVKVAVTRMKWPDDDRPSTLHLVDE